MGLNWGFGDGRAGLYMGRCMAWCLVMWCWGLINAVLYYLGLGGGRMRIGVGWNWSLGESWFGFGGDVINISTDGNKGRSLMRKKPQPYSKSKTLP